MFLKVTLQALSDLCIIRRTLSRAQAGGGDGSVGLDEVHVRRDAQAWDAMIHHIAAVDLGVGVCRHETDLLVESEPRHQVLQV